MKEDKQPSHKEYATVAEDEGENYRDIADTMTSMGFEMNHSSARNHVVRVLKKFAEEFSAKLGSSYKSEAVMYKIAKDPDFQASVSELLQVVEQDEKESEGSAKK